MGSGKIYIAYEWLATTIFAFSDAVQARRKAPQRQIAKPHSLNRLDA